MNDYCQISNTLLIGGDQLSVQIINPWILLGNLELLLQIENVDSPDRLLRALSAFEVGRGDIADYVIREDAKAAGCDSVVTFDKALHKEEMFVSP